MGDGAEDRLQQLYPEVFGRSRPLPSSAPSVFVELEDDEIVITRR